jgi:SAM-dependent methyltransferase
METHATASRSASSFVDEVTQRFAVGPAYARSYLDYWARKRGRPVSSLAEVLSGPPPEPMWFEYALSTNWRGRQLVEMLSFDLPGTGGRYLDVGCGFGGFLVAFSERGYAVTGIEIDPDRISLAQANCADHRMEGCVHAGSVLDTAFLSTLGRFDVITCIDVIEHVLDVEAALQNMVGLLEPGGLLLLEIPNKDSLNFVAADGHFGLWGITQLGRRDAIEYHRAFFGFDYDVGDYFELDHYRRILATLGCATSLMSPGSHPPRRFRQVPTLLGSIAWQHWRFLKHRASRLPRPLVRHLQASVARYLCGLAGRGGGILTGHAAVLAFRDRYLVDFWTLLARKPR